jgi:hypothetical protein
MLRTTSTSTWADARARLYSETRKVFIIQEQEKGIIVVNIVPKENPLRKTPIQKKHNATDENGEQAVVASLLHLVHVAIILSMLIQGSAFGNFLLLALALDFLCDEVLVRFQTALDVNLELDDVVEHTLKLCVQFFAHSRGAQSQLFVPVIFFSKLLEFNSDSGMLTQGWCSSPSAPSTGRSR